MKQGVGGEPQDDTSFSAFGPQKPSDGDARPRDSDESHPCEAMNCHRDMDVRPIEGPDNLTLVLCRVHRKRFLGVSS